MTTVGGLLAIWRCNSAIELYDCETGVLMIKKMTIVFFDNFLTDFFDRFSDNAVGIVTIVFECSLLVGISDSQVVRRLYPGLLMNEIILINLADWYLSIFFLFLDWMVSLISDAFDSESVLKAILTIWGTFWWVLIRKLGIWISIRIFHFAVMK